MCLHVHYQTHYKFFCSVINLFQCICIHVNIKRRLKTEHFFSLPVSLNSEDGVFCVFKLWQQPKKEPGRETLEWTLWTHQANLMYGL